MKTLIDQNVNLTDCNKHAAMMVLVYDLFRDQAQPRRIVRCTPSGLVFDLRVNLPVAQLEGVILKPLRDSLVDYRVTADRETKELTVELKDVPDSDISEDTAVDRGAGAVSIKELLELFEKKLDLMGERLDQFDNQLDEMGKDLTEALERLKAAEAKKAPAKRGRPANDKEPKADQSS